MAKVGMVNNRSVVQKEKFCSQEKPVLFTFILRMLRWICFSSVIDPVVSRYGDSFERAAIFEWIEEGNDHCPITGEPLRASCLVSNKKVSDCCRLLLDGFLFV